MTSDVLDRWKGERAARLDQLVLAHKEVGGTGPGRRWQTEQLNWALILRLAGEFQGFCIELHDLAAREFAVRVGGRNQPLQSTLLGLLTRARQLDRGNAHPDSLDSDFGRFGGSWWPTVQRGDARTEDRLDHLRRLNRARNAIAHSDLGRLEALAREGYPVKLVTFRRWRSALDGLTGTMDSALATILSGVVGGDVPW